MGELRSFWIQKKSILVAVHFQSVTRDLGQESAEKRETTWPTNGTCFFPLYTALYWE